PTYPLLPSTPLFRSPSRFPPIRLSRFPSGYGEGESPPHIPLHPPQGSPGSPATPQRPRRSKNGPVPPSRSPLDRFWHAGDPGDRSEEHTSELQSREN